MEDRAYKDEESESSSSPSRRLIVGGHTIAADDDYDGDDGSDWPTYAAAFAWTGIGAGGWGCGGALIHSDVVLTGAHCAWVVRGHGFWIGTATINGSQWGQFYPTAEMVVHPEYTDQMLTHNDIMIVKLNGTVTEVDEFYDFNVDPTVPANDTTVRVVGFGTTQEGGNVSQTLREVDVQIMGSEVCAATWAALNPALHLCAGSVEGGKDACDSDSGSPLFIVSEGRPPMQVGIVGDGIGCARAGVPAIYTRISTYASWIESTLCEISSNPPKKCLASTAGMGQRPNPGEPSSNDSFDDKPSFWRLTGMIVVFVALVSIIVRRWYKGGWRHRLGYQKVADADATGVSLSV